MTARLRPGGFAWLLRHELRLALRGTGSRGGWWRRAAPLLLLAALAAAGGIALAVVVAAAEHNSDPLPPVLDLRLYALLGVLLLGVAAIMLSTASVAVLRTFHDRGDLDLLLSAPVPPARILAAKVAGIIVGVAAPFVALVGPFTLASSLLGHPAWLGGLAMVVVAAIAATATALLLVAVLFDTVGPRRARAIVQLGAALAGGAAFLATQLANIAPDAGRRLSRTIGDAPPALGWAGRAVCGDLLPLLSLAAPTLVAAALATRFAARHLASSADRATRRAVVARRLRFRSGLTRIVVAKELRSIARDPELITQVALRLVYLIPLAALLVRGTDGVDPTGLAGTVTGFAALLASSLAWIIVCGEDAPDLLASAPAAAPVAFRGKLLAAALIPGCAVAAAAAALAPASPWVAAVVAVVGLVAVLTAALLQAWFGRPAPRSAFRRRQSGSFAVGIGEVVLAGAWSSTTTLLARGSAWAVAPALLGAMVMAGAVAARTDVSASGSSDPRP